VRHAKDCWKTTNTGRLAAMAMPNALLRDYGRPFETVAPPVLEDAWLLFPDTAPTTPVGQPRCVVVLDGTWPQTKRMVQRIPWLRGLPRLSLSPKAPWNGLRRPPHARAMSTLTAIARAVEHLEGPEPAALLDALHAEFSDRVRWLKGAPAAPGYGLR